MSSILDTLPPLGDLEQAIYERSRDFIGSANHTAVEAVIRERDRIVVEHVVRMCAEACRSVENENWTEHMRQRLGASYLEGQSDGAFECAAKIMKLLEPKP